MIFFESTIQFLFMTCAYCFDDREDLLNDAGECHRCGYPTHANAEVQKLFRMDQIDLEHDLWEVRNIRRFWMAYALATILFALICFFLTWKASLFFLFSAIVFFLSFRQHNWRYQWMPHLGIWIFYVCISMFEMETGWSPIYAFGFCSESYGHFEPKLSTLCNLIPLLYLAFRLFVLVALTKGLYKTVIHRKMGQRINYIIEAGREMKDSKYHLRS